MAENSGGIAIVGIGCRFPGADNIEEFWRVLSKGENHVNEIPLERWNVEAFYDEDADAPGKTYVRRAGLLKNYDKFDKRLFGINDQEAERMDPQQKFVLECVFMALQDGGITRENIRSSNTGVFIGVMNDDYSRMTSINDASNYSVTGASNSIMSARVSYVFDLRGPCMVIDSACSSSLIAIHLASQALLSGDCNMAVCGGVNALLTPTIFAQLSKARMLSRTGQCQAFSASADGYARGEGCGIVLLKRLSDAIKDGDKIWATIVTGTNQDGRAVTPMTAPSGEQQELLLKTVYKKAGIDASEIDYIEAHGTGTVAGDPVEVNSLGRFFQSTNVQRKRYIGSVKTNIGHLESAAGVAGLIKVLLMMKNNKIVTSRLIGGTNKQIDFEKFSFEVPTDLKDWERQRKLACVNSFGFGGSNCHAVLSSCTTTTSDITEENGSKVPLVFCFSGQDQKSLKESIQEFIDFAETNTEINLRAVSYSSTVRRDHFEVRKAVTANSLTNLVDKLKRDNIVERSDRPQRVVFVFGGMGIAWKGMCKELMSTFRVFKEKIQEIDSCLKEYCSWSLYERLCDDYNVEDKMFGPIATFACQVALAALWKHLGIKPDCVLGQSIGEVAASHVAGVWSLSEAVKIIFHRTDVLANATGGKMLLIRNCLIEKLEKRLCEYDGRANIALYYSPKSCTISGDTNAVEQIEKDLLNSTTEQKYGITLQTLKLSIAFHSHHTEESKQKLLSMLVGMKGCSPKTEIISTVSGKTVRETDVFLAPDYWGKNIRDPVQFGKGVLTATKADSFNIFVEIGPKPVLASHMRDLFTDNDNTVVVPSMKQNSELTCLTETACKMYELGIDLNWTSLYKQPQQNTELPKYIFCRNKCLHISEGIQQELMGIKSSNKQHPFLKTMSYTDSSLEHKIIVSPTSVASVYEHRFSGKIIVPGALYVEAGLALANIYFSENENQKCIISLRFKSTVELRRGKTEQLDIDITKTDMPESFTFVVCDKGNVHAEGKVERQPVFEKLTIDIQSVKMRCGQILTKAELYTILHDAGMTFGDMLQLIGESVKNGTEVLSNLSLNSCIKDEMKETTMHPAILDAMLHTTKALYQEGGVNQRALPVQLEGFWIRHSIEDNMLVYTKNIKDTDSTSIFHIFLLSQNGTVIAEINKFVIRYLTSQNKQTMFEIKWSPTEQLLTNDIHENPAQRWLIITDKKQNDAISDHIYLEYLENDIAANDVGTILNARALTLDSMSAIVFLCRQQTVDISSSEIFLHMITRQSMTLRSLLLHLRDQNASIPLFIVTENAVYTGNDDTPINLVAGSCWGFIRSVLREQVYNMTTIVDLHTDENNAFDTLMTDVVQHLLTQDKNKGIRELLINKNYVWCQQVFSNEDMPVYRNNRPDKLCKANLFSQSEDSIWKPYLLYHSQKTQCHLQQQVEIMTTNVVIHNSSLYPQCVKVNHLSTTASNVITLEIIGKVPTGNDGQRNVVAFFPCRVSTFTTVPKQCVVEINKVPFYEPGLLTKLVLLWQHCLLTEQHVEAPSTHHSWFLMGICKVSPLRAKEIFILCSDASRPVASALTFMLETKQRDTNIEIVDINSLSSVQSDSEAIIVSTIQLNEHIIDAICQQWPKAKHLICMDQLLPRHVSLQLFNNNVKLQVDTVRASDIFTPSAAMDIMPKLMTWIVNHKDVVHKIVEKCQDVINQQTDTNVATLIQNSTIQLSGSDQHDIQTVHVTAFEDTLIRSDGVYIVVGGLTGLGWECVQFLAKREAGVVFIINRRKVQEDRLLEILKIEKDYGCEISVKQADVTNMPSLKKAFKTIEDKFPRKQLKGVYFGAAVLEDKTLINMSQDTFEKVAAPKIQGAWNMHLLTEKIPLDFFIMHSSVTSVFGTPGQSNYGAANAFQDSLAQKRRQAGLVGQSINWGPLTVGMLQKNLVQSVEAQGYILLSRDEIHNCLLSALMIDKPTILAAKFNSIKLATSIRSEKNQALEFMLNPILGTPSVQNASTTPSSSTQDFDLGQLMFADTRTRLSTIRKYITGLLTNILTHSINLATGVANLGLDSMQAMTISNQIFDTFQVRITPNGLLQDNLSANEIIDVINTNILTPVDKFDVLSISQDTLTYMEYTFYKIYCNNPADPGLYYVSELRLPQSLAKPEIWKEVADQLTSRHEVLRTTFEEVPESENIRWNVKRKINPAMKPDFRIVKEEDGYEIEKQTTEVFHLQTQPPFRIIFIIGQTCYFRTIYNSLGFDMDGIGVIFKDIVNILLYLQNDMKPPNLQTVGGSRIVVEMEKVLQEKGHELKDFWKHRLEVDIPAVNLGTTERLKELPSGKYQQKKGTLEPAVYNALIDLSKSKGLSMYKLMASFYQLLLHLMTDITNVAIITAVDIKQYIPNVGNVVSRGTNFIPLLAKFPSDNVSIEEFLRINETALQTAIDHCLCPIDIIDEVVGSGKIANISRNKIVMVQDDFATLLLKHSNDSGYPVQLTRSEDLGIHTETQLSFRTRPSEKQMTLHLMYNSNSLSDTRAQQIIKAFQEIVSKITSDVSVTIASLRNMASITELRACPDQTYTEVTYLK